MIRGLDSACKASGKILRWHGFCYMNLKDVQDERRNIFRVFCCLVSCILIHNTANYR